MCTVRFLYGGNEQMPFLKHTDPDYSCAYVILHIDNSSCKGHGFTFTIGRGTEIGTSTFLVITDIFSSA